MRVLWITAFAILVDQLAKWVVVKEMYMGQSIPLLGDWFKLTFTTNPGMAFGISFGPRGLVTVLSVAATGLIVAYMYKVRDGYTPYLASLALILGGALGNIIDRMFYGIIYQGGPLFTGEVVDFIHFDVWKGYIPAVVPVWGGSYMALFPIWNVADMAIVCGVIGILLFQNKFHEQYLALDELTDDLGREGVQESHAPLAGENIPAEASAPLFQEAGTGEDLTYTEHQDRNRDSEASA